MTIKQFVENLPSGKYTIEQLDEMSDGAYIIEALENFMDKYYTKENGEYVVN